VSWKGANPGSYKEGNLCGEELVQALVPLYFRVELFPYDHYTHTRVISHLKAEKYQPIRELLIQIYKFEDDHNASVSLLLGSIERDIKSMLEKFPSLKEREPHQQYDYYYYASINTAIQNRLKPQPNPQKITTIEYAGVALTAVILEASSRDRFVKETAALVDKYIPRIQTALGERPKYQALLSDLKACAAEIVDGIDTYRKLDGKCDFENQ
jgi:hypothetical protein